MRLFAFLCSEFLATLNIQITNIMLQNHAKLAAAVRWKRETNPVVFGRNVTLTCIVDKKEACDITATRRWDLGTDRNTLLFNGLSTKTSKYYEIVKEPCENFSMVIMKFDLKDVDVEYWCSFGFETSRQMLMLDDRNFIGLPTKTDIYSSPENNKQRGLDLKISFKKVYPKPKCKIKIGDTSWVTVTVVSHPTGIFYNSSVHYKTIFPKSQCHNNVTTICSLLQSYTILQMNKRLNCTDAGVSEKPEMYSSLKINEKRKLHLKISFFKVYSKPKCKIKIGDTSWVPLTVVSHPTGVFFNSSLHYKKTFQKGQCHDNVTTICSLLSDTILQLNKRLNCTNAVVNRETNYSLKMAITPVLISTAFVIIGFVCFLRIKRISKARPDQHNSIEEMHALENCENKDSNAVYKPFINNNRPC